jgi:hypothetical protein
MEIKQQPADQAISGHPGRSDGLQKVFRQGLAQKHLGFQRLILGRFDLSLELSK